MRKFTRGILTVMLIFIAVMFVSTVGDMLFDKGVANAELKRAKLVGFMGVDYSSSLGNTTGASTAYTLSANEFPDEVNCFYSVQNASGVIVANTSTVALQTSYKGSDWDTFHTATVAASTVTGIRNTGADGSPFGDKWRMLITAIQNANDSYVTGQCLFE